VKNKKQKQIVHYDAKSDVLYFGAQHGIEEEYSEVAPGVGIELDKKGNIIGIEILNASKVMRPVSRSLFSPRRISEREFVFAR
jgi:uncharacterized protein YuzE